MSSIVFTGGGTGGHVYPGLAVLQRFSPEDRARVVWIGSADGVERRIVTDAGVPFHSIPAGKLRRYVAWRNVTDVFRVAAGVFTAFTLLGRLNARVVFSKGGYVAVPVAVAARLRGIPVVIHESDADPGLATRLTAPLAQSILVPYQETAEMLPNRLRDRVQVLGNPVRREFFAADRGGALSRVGLSDDGSPVVFVTGGSLGAQQINRLVEALIDRLSRRAIIVHQTGAQGADAIPTIAARAQPGRYAAAPTFTEEYAPILRRADLVVARAGAGTLWEIAACRRPSILIPLSAGASRGDQLRNAERYGRAGAAVTLSDPDLDARRLYREVERLLDDAGGRAEMRRAAERWAPHGAAERIAHAILRCARPFPGESEPVE